MRPALLLISLSLASCGYLGPIQPPVLAIPQRVTDLRAAQFGSRIVAQFTIADLTTEGQPLKNMRSVEVYVGVALNPFSHAAYDPQAKRYDVPAANPGPLTREIPVADWVRKDVTIFVRATGPKGKTSDWSNAVALSIVAPIPKPSDLKAENIPAGIAVTWKETGPSGLHFHLYRASAGQQPSLLDSFTDAQYLDTQIDFNTTYQYFVEAFSTELQRSDMAQSEPVLRADVFAPSVPAGVTAEPGATSIELSWERNTDPRFQGYNLYRSVDDGPYEKIVSLQVAPAYSDRAIEAGKKYRYQVTAVGTNGLESSRSAPVEAIAR